MQNSYTCFKLSCSGYICFAHVLWDCCAFLGVFVTFLVMCAVIPHTTSLCTRVAEFLYFFVYWCFPLVPRLVSLHKYFCYVASCDFCIFFMYWFHLFVMRVVIPHTNSWCTRFVGFLYVSGLLDPLLCASYNYSTHYLLLCTRVVNKKSSNDMIMYNIYIYLYI
jgi:hypothetical protein